jgi:hypothetical protein
MTEPDDLDEYEDFDEPDDLDGLGESDAEALGDLDEQQLELALAWLHEKNPLAGYGTPVTRRHKPNATGRAMHDVLPTL